MQTARLHATGKSGTCEEGQVLSTRLRCLFTTRRLLTVESVCYARRTALKGHRGHLFCGELVQKRPITPVLSLCKARIARPRACFVPIFGCISTGHALPPKISVSVFVCTRKFEVKIDDEALVLSNIGDSSLQVRCDHRHHARLCTAAGYAGQPPRLTSLCTVSPSRPPPPNSQRTT